MRLAGRMFPLGAIGLAAYDSWQLYQWFQNRITPGNVATPLCVTPFTHGGAAWMKGATALAPECGLDIGVTSQWTGIDPSRPGFEVGEQFPADARVTVREHYAWPAGSRKLAPARPAFQPARVPEVDPHVDPLPWIAPAIDPFSNPVSNPAPDTPQLPYWALPYRVPNPFRSPTEQPQRGPVPESRPAPLRDPLAFPLEIGQPGVAGRTFVIESGKGLQVLNAPASPPNPRPPGRGEVEAKQAVKFAGLVWRVANITTETRDFIREVWRGIDRRQRLKDNPEWAAKVRLPKGHVRIFREPVPPLQDMMRDIARHGLDTNVPVVSSKGKPLLDEYGKPRMVMDWGKAIDNVIMNEITDYIYGQFGRQLGKASRRSRRPVGYGAGPIH